MDAPLYDVYLTGKLVVDTTATQAAQRLATLFKSTPEIMAGMLTGKPQLLKRGVDKNTAMKYREALLNAGIETAFKAQTGAAGAPLPAAASAPMASTATQTQWNLAPAGADLLQPDERRQPASVAIDISALQLAPLGPLSPATSTAAAATPDTSYLSLAAAGSDLLSSEEKQHPPVAVPDIDGLSLAPAGTPLETLHSATAPITPDISTLSLAPAGADLLLPEQRDKPAPAAPSTDHLKLAN